MIRLTTRQRIQLALELIQTELGADSPILAQARIVNYRAENSTAAWLRIEELLVQHKLPAIPVAISR